MTKKLCVQLSSSLLFTFLNLSLSQAGSELHLQSGTTSLEQIERHAEFDAKIEKFQSEGLRAAAVSMSAPSYFILQFHKAILESDRLALQNSNIEVLRYIPDDAYIVRANQKQLADFAAQYENVNGFVPYGHNLREAPELKYRNVFNSENIQLLSVQLFPGVSVDQVKAVLEQKQIAIVSIGKETLTVKAKTRQIREISSIDGVEWVGQKSQMKLYNYKLPKGFLSGESASVQTFAADFSDLTGYESGTKIMNFEKAWERGFRGNGQIVAVADTGLDTGVKSTLSPDFANLHEAFALGYGSKDWADHVGHGTHVSGSVAGQGVTSSMRIYGGAVGAKIIIQGLWSSKYQSLTTPEDLGDLFLQAYENGARIHTNSWGDPNARGVYNTETAAVDRFVWEHPEMLILFASGNDGVDGDRDGRVDPGSVSAPATSKNIISVGASENLLARGGIQRKVGEIEFSPGDKPWPVPPLSDDTFSNHPNGMAAFSSRGPTADGRLKPDLVAPGTNILSNCSHTETAERMWGRYNPDYCYSGGTSMATPLVAGAAAVVRERVMRLKNMGSPSAALIKGVMIHTAFDMYPGQFGESGAQGGQEFLQPGPNPDQGYGRVDVGSAVLDRLLLVDNKAGVMAGEVKEHFTQEPVQKITLVYSDAPAAVTARRALVNNLDLEVVANGKTFTSSSIVNNTEQIFIDEPVYGPVSVRVRGTNVPIGVSGRQPYALVFSATYNKFR